MRPADPIGEQATASQGVYERLARYPLLDALTERRSRRFGKGMSLNGGPLAYHSTHRDVITKYQAATCQVYVGPPRWAPRSSQGLCLPERRGLGNWAGRDRKSVV